jgi:nitrogen fixation protein NifU and related proteins
VDFYRETIIDHYDQPRHWGLLDPADIDHEEKNPLCGDTLRLTMRVEEDKITEIGWQGEGCIISQATASMLGETLIGKSLEEARAISKESILEMLGIELGPVRLKCALLSLKVMKVGAYGLAGWNESDSER